MFDGDTHRAFLGQLSTFLAIDPEKVIRTDLGPEISQPAAGECIAKLKPFLAQLEHIDINVIPEPVVRALSERLLALNRVAQDMANFSIANFHGNARDHWRGTANSVRQIAAEVMGTHLPPFTPVVLMHLGSQQLLTATAQAQEQVKQLGAEIAANSTLLKDSEALLESRLQGRLDSFAERTTKLADAALNRINALEKEIEDQAKTAEKTIADLVKSSHQRIGLGSSRKHWNKAKSVRVLMALLVALVAIGLGHLCSITLWPVASDALQGMGAPQPKDAAPPYHLYFKLTLVVLVVVWGAKILVRLFLSYLHAASEAMDRVAMIDTYVSLTAEKSLRTAERVVIMRAIFKNSATGIVRDDAAPTHPATLLVKAVQGR